MTKVYTKSVAVVDVDSHKREREFFRNQCTLFAVDRTAVQTNGDILLSHDKRLANAHYTLLHTHMTTDRQLMMIYQDVWQSTGANVA